MSVKIIMWVNYYELHVVNLILQSHKCTNKIHYGYKNWAIRQEKLFDLMYSCSYTWNTIISSKYLLHLISVRVKLRMF